MRCYSYLVQVSSEDDKEHFSNIILLVEYLNKKMGFNSVYTKDIIQNYFRPRKNCRRENPLISSLYSISRTPSKSTCPI